MHHSFIRSGDIRHQSRERDIISSLYWSLRSDGLLLDAFLRFVSEEVRGMSGYFAAFRIIAYAIVQLKWPQSKESLLISIVFSSFPGFSFDANIISHNSKDSLWRL